MKDRIKGLFVSSIRVYIFIISSLNKIFSKKRDVLSSTMLYICKAIETKNKLVSFLVRPKNPESIPILDGVNQCNSFAIILQGPICKKDAMTVQTILFYKKVYPLARIIVSTWDDEQEDTLKEMARLGAVVVTSKKPELCGVYNVNLQLTSSLAGVKKAKEMGCEFVVKTRTDQRVCKSFIFDTMISAVKYFKSDNVGQKGRIVALGGGNGGMFIPYHLSDFLYLGYTDDLLRLFDISLDCRHFDVDLYKKIDSLTRLQYAEQMVAAEIYILKNYCINILGRGGRIPLKNIGMLSRTV